MHFIVLTSLLALTSALPLASPPPTFPHFGQVAPTGHHNHTTTTSPTPSSANEVHLPGHLRPSPFPPGSNPQRVPADLSVPDRDLEHDHRRLPPWLRPRPRPKPSKRVTMPTKMVAATKSVSPTPGLAPRDVEHSSLVSAFASASAIETPTPGKPVPGMPTQGELSWGYVLEPTPTAVKGSKPLRFGPWETHVAKPIRPRSADPEADPEPVRIVHPHLLGGGLRVGQQHTNGTNVAHANSTDAVVPVRKGLLNNLLTMAYGALSNGVGSGIKTMLGNAIEDQIVCTEEKEACEKYAAQEKARKEEEEKEEKAKEEKEEKEEKAKEEEEAREKKEKEAKEAERKKEEEEKKKQDEEEQEQARKDEEAKEKMEKEKEAREKEEKEREMCTKVCTGKMAMCPKMCEGLYEKEERRWVA